MGTFFDVLDTTARTMSSLRLWMDAIANNLSNANTTKTDDGKAYQRQIPIFRTFMKDMLQKDMGMLKEDKIEVPPTFVDPWKTTTPTLSDMAMLMQTSQPEGFEGDLGEGIVAVDMFRVKTAGQKVYNPGHPDADAEGFVQMPNVNVIMEMVDMISVNRAYEASVAIANAAKSMENKAMEIGK